MAARTVNGLMRIPQKMLATSKTSATLKTLATSANFSSFGRSLQGVPRSALQLIAPSLHFAISKSMSTDAPERVGPIVQRKAPDFSGTAVVDGQFKTIKLSDFQGKYLILLFYPLDFTFVCPTEIVAFSDYADKFRALNTEVVAISTDSHFSHLAWTNLPRKEGGLGPMKIALLADFSKKISRDYGVLIEEEGIALRGMFIIDPKQVLRQVTINDLPVGRSVEEALRLVQAFQFVEKHGEVCPAGWLPKSDTIKPDPVKSKEYFRKVAEK